MIFWFRRDLRLEDNAGLYAALKNHKNVRPIFIFDKNIIDPLPANDARVHFIHKTLVDLNFVLKEYGSRLEVFHDTPENVFNQLIQDKNLSAVYANHDYEPKAILRDEKVAQILKKKGIPFHTFKDQCVFEKNEVVKDDGKPYTVFTPYKNKWLKSIDSYYVKAYPNDQYKNSFYKNPHQDILTLKEMGFTDSDIVFPTNKVKKDLLLKYDKLRDFPAADNTSHLGLHFRFGTISIRKAVTIAQKINATWLSELIWRDFFMQILFHFPHVEKKSFRSAYDKIPWLNDKKDFKKWCEGMTGYPLVDAGMRELNATGYMHNRVRMVTASFLTKHLLIDWRWGEKYFAEKLLDYDLSANNGNWQWAAGTGCDAAPYFRVFNPSEQLKKFDSDLIYTRKWVPEFGSKEYPAPVVEHAFARNRAIKTYQTALKVD